MIEKLSIREAENTDIAALAKLVTQLGYRTTEAEMTTRFNNIDSHADYKTLVATNNTSIVGMIGLSKNFSYEQNGYYVRVLALVVSEEFQQKGIGKRLMKAAEDWAREIGASSVLLNCGNRDERV